ncbi:DUF397 domain-containing protein [Actinopolyspora mortivallis]|uniref:DUF397 domain-containing protein n=1 Tax=Actinopolyspora mortivallis TaxID=33906 RepID=A0A2T0GRG7_ACTMO|nr:DUF397 domain-containing protein [Actinopolyspora mortivallis]PRW61699.1 DUF397 domain-containing protein [Actinopolyspora mortivallis]
MTIADLSQARWRKSTRSNGGGQCLEVGYVSEVVGIRDTKDRHGGTLAVDRATWASFVRTIKQGHLDG